MPDYLELRNVDRINQPLLSENLEANITAWFNHAMLGIGNYYNVRIPTSGHYGGNFHILRLSEDRGYTKGRVWDGVRKDWIWETGVSYTPQPIQISGVYVGSNFYPIGTTGNYAYKIDYPNGRIIFDTAIASTSVVKCEHSYRYYSFQSADEKHPTYLQPRSFRPDSQFSLYASGDWSVHPEMRTQMPVIKVQAIPKTSFYGKELGGASDWVRQDVLLSIKTETPGELKFIHDTILNQRRKNLNAFDKDLMIRNTGCPLDIYGNVVSSFKTYPDWIKPVSQGGYNWENKQLFFVNTASVQSPETLIKNRQNNTNEALIVITVETNI